MYYLQSRYYNAEWGRFINADAIIGSAGELLGHNVFAYCKNNFVNEKDPSGFRPIHTEGEETVEMSESSYRATNTAAKNRSSNYQSKTSVYTPAPSVKKGITSSGISYSVAAGARISGSIQLASDKNGKLGILIGVAGGVGTPSAGIGIVYSWADGTLKDMKGFGNSAGFSGSGGLIPIGAGCDRVWSSSSKGYNINVGAKVEPFVELHYEKGYTILIPLN